MSILFCNHFLKQLKRIRSITEVDVLSLCKKFPNTKDLIELDSNGIYKILKGYLLGKRVRILLLYHISNDQMIPVTVVKKEMRKGQNIIKNNYQVFFIGDIEKTLEDVRSKNYKEKEY